MPNFPWLVDALSASVPAPSPGYLPDEDSWLNPAVVRWIWHNQPDEMLIDYQAKLGNGKKRVDIMTLAKNGDIVIYELKKAAVKDALCQARKYAVAIQNWTIKDLARQRARKLSHCRTPGQIALDLGKHTGGKLSGNIQIKLVADNFNAAAVHCACRLAGPAGSTSPRSRISGVTQLSYKMTGNESNFTVCLGPPRTKPGRRPSVPACRSHALVVPPISPQGFKTWDCRFATARANGVSALLTRFFCEHLRYGTKNNSGKKTGQLYFAYTERKSEWEDLYHVTMPTKGAVAHVGKRTDGMCSQSLPGGKSKNTDAKRKSGGRLWSERSMTAQELYCLFPVSGPNSATDVAGRLPKCDFRARSFGALAEAPQTDQNAAERCRPEEDSSTTKGDDCLCGHCGAEQPKFGGRIPTDTNPRD